MNAKNQPTQFGLTPQQRNCFDAIEHYIAAHRQSPSLEDIRKMLGLKSKSGIKRLLDGLVERGWIRFSPTMARSIAIIRPPQPPVYVLPAAVEERLRAHCLVTGDSAADVVADAVSLFFDEAEGSIAA